MSRKTTQVKAADRTLVDAVRQSPVDRGVLSWRRRWFTMPALILITLGVVLLAIAMQIRRLDVPDELANDEEHFKYGSIGSDTLEGNGVPYWIWRAMPQVCSELLPGGLASIGIIQEPGMDRPIGFSKRRTGFFDSLGLNCAICHTASVRETPDGPARAYLAGASHQLDLGAYFNFLFQCGQSSGFTVDRVMAAINNMTQLNPLEKLVYKRAIQETGPKLAAQQGKLAWINQRPAWGPGRVDTFNPYRSLIFNVPVPDNSIGTADFMTIWSQGIRAGLYVHWDGNNPSVRERNYSAALGAGAAPSTLDHPKLERIRNWIWNLQAPRYPFAVDYDLARAGKPIYDAQCGACHEPGGQYYGTVTANKNIGTDPARSDAFDPAMAGLMNRIGEGYPWRFTHFKPTGGYVNHPLDGTWLRAPYLHNGSVPTLRDLLSPAAERPAQFYKGYDVYDQQRLGFVSTVASHNGRTFFKYDASQPGNHNTGHEYGTTLGDKDKDALLEYLKTK